MNNTKIPNDFFKTLPFSNFEKQEPIKIPTIENPVKVNNIFQSIALFNSVVKPKIDLIAMINKDVPTASFILIFVSSNKAGIIRKPPPAPTKPVTSPTTIPSKAIKTKLFSRSLLFLKFSFHEYNIEKAAISITKAKKTNINVSF